MPCYVPAGGRGGGVRGFTLTGALCRWCEPGLTVTLVWKKPTRRGKSKPQTATTISLQFWGLLTCAQLYCDWSLLHKPVRMKWKCSRKVREMPPLALYKKKKKKKKKNGKLKHHILPFSGSAHHIPVHSSLVPAHFSIFRYHSISFCFILVSFRLVPAYSGRKHFSTGGR